jgi:hypothetical protein
MGIVFFRTLLEDVRQPEKNDEPAAPRVLTLKRRKLPRIGGGVTETLPEVAVDVIVVSVCHAPHALLFVESENSTSNPVMALEMPADAPAHESVTLFSAIVWLTDNETGAFAAVVLGVHSTVNLMLVSSFRPANDI